MKHTLIMNVKTYQSMIKDGPLLASSSRKRITMSRNKRSRNNTCRSELQLPWVALLFSIVFTLAFNGTFVKSFHPTYSSTPRRRSVESTSFRLSASLISHTQHLEPNNSYLHMSKREFLRQHIWIKGQEKFHSFRHKISSWRKGNNDKETIVDQNKHDGTATTFIVDGGIHHRQQSRDVTITQLGDVESYADDNYSDSEGLQLSSSSRQQSTNREVGFEINESFSEVARATRVVAERETVAMLDTQFIETEIESIEAKDNKIVKGRFGLHDKNVKNALIDLTTIPTRPVRDRSQFTSIEIEFDNMIGELYFSQEDIASIGNVRVRAILEGIIASDNEPAVYRAFQVLFQDLYPLRIAGRLIFKTLRELTTKSALEQRNDVELVSTKTGLDPSQIQDLRQMFIGVASKLNGDMYLTKEQLSTEAVFLTDVATDVMGLNHIDELFEYLFANNSNVDSSLRTSEDDPQQHLTFPQLMIGIQAGIVDTCGLDQCDPQEVFEQLLVEIHERMPLPQSFQLSTESIKFNDRYNEMVQQFRHWQHLIPHSGTGRRLDVVRGCFVGADNVKVVEALRTVYVDYSAFRFAGDVIFKLVSSVLRMRGAKM